MASWKTYAKAARNTARRHSTEPFRTTEDGGRRSPGEDRSDRDSARDDRPHREHSREDRPRRDVDRRAQDDRPRRTPDARDESRGRTLTGGDYARAARRALDEGTRESRDSFRRSGEKARRDAAAYAVVAQRRVRKAQLGRRIAAAFRDAVLVGLSLFIIWFVVTRTGVQIPFTAVLAVVGIIVVLRFGWALIAQFRSQQDGAAELGDDAPDARDAGDHHDDPRSYDPSRERPSGAPASHQRPEH